MVDQDAGLVPTRFLPWLHGAYLRDSTRQYHQDHLDGKDAGRFDLVSVRGSPLGSLWKAFGKLSSCHKLCGVSD
jgi:hypothetical protein